MIRTVEVYADHVRGLLAVAWPTVPGYVIYSERGLPEAQLETVYTLPAGMTRLVDADTARAANTEAVASCATTRRTVKLTPRENPARYQRFAEGA
jgi:hypothetical protein